MTPNPFLGVGLHAGGGLAAGSFYIPYKKVRQWAWESYWLVGGVFSWVLVPWLVGVLTVPDLFGVLRAVPGSAIAYTYLSGLAWGIGGLTFGLSMRYLGMSLGYALALGFCAAFGTILPPAYRGELGEVVSKTSGLVMLGGVLVCLVGIAICGMAGVRKERELTEGEKKETIAEFNFAKGLWVAIFAGIMSAFMAVGVDQGAPLRLAAVDKGTGGIFQNSPVWIVVLAGGFTTNFLWCAYLNVRNRTGGDYTNAKMPLANNYLFSGLAGTTWYCQFLLYGMGTTLMGDYDFSSWTIHMAFIIVFSNIWGLVLREWKGSSFGTRRLVFLGIAVLVLSTIVVGYGNYLAEFEKAAAAV